MAAVSLAAKSLYFDSRIAFMSGKSPVERVSFIYHKWRIIAALAARRESSIRIENALFQVNGISDLGTLQSCIVDLFDEIMSPLLIGERSFVVDIGANIGQFAFALKWLLPNVRVFAVEPDPIVYRRLLENLGNVVGIEARNCAVGAITGEAILYRQPLSIMSTLFPTGEDEQNNQIRVSVNRLDELLDGLPNPDLLKIDVEGAEYQVLQGAADTLQRTEILIVEISLSRGASNGLDVLTEIRRLCPKSRILKFGRPLGAKGTPACQDVVLSLRG